ncbi:MAG: DUF362 domain-containing protein [Fervidicoccaceae archaeon]
MLKIAPRKRIHINKQCNQCGKCVSVCPTQAIQKINGKIKVNTRECIACYACVILCPKEAIKIIWYNGKILELDV